MNRTVISILVVLLATGLCAAEPASPEKKPKPIRILFIGNSYTTVNDLPGMLAAMSRKAKVDRPIETARSTRGGWTLQRHHDDERSTAKTMIQDGPWDYIVLQEQSQMPFLYPKVTHKYGVMLGKLIQAEETTPLFYMTWAREHQPENQAKIRDTYQGMGKQLNAPVAPVGLAWEAVLKGQVHVKLHQKDRSHPTTHGTYLSACVFFAMIYKQSPEGLPGSLTVKQNGRTRTLCRLQAQYAKLFQRTAWQVVQPLVEHKTNEE